MTLKLVRNPARRCAAFAAAFALAVCPALAMQPRPAEPLPAGRPSPPAREGQGGPVVRAAAERVSPDGIEVAGRDAGAVRTPSAPLAFGGPRPDAGRTGPLSQRVASYRLQAVLDPRAHTVEGKEELTWMNRSDRPVRSLYFHLYLNAFEGPGSTFMAEKAVYGRFRSGVETRKGEWGFIEIRSIRQGARAATWTFVHPDGGPETDHTVARVDLPEEVAPGATATLQIDFHDQLPRVVARTGYFKSYHLVGQWFPKVGVLELPGERGATAPRWNCHEFHLHSEFYADFGTYEAKIVAPKEFLVRATGEEQGEPKETPQGLLHRFVQDDVHDFVFTAWDGFARPLSAVYEGAGSPHVAVEVLHPPEYAAAGRIALQATLDALRFFSRTLGPYPYRHLTCVVPPFNAGESGGMEYETFFTSLGGRSEAALALVRYVTVHEFGHGYFMGLLASNEFEEPFLDEGINELWDNRMLEGESLSLPLPLPLRALGFRLPPIAYWDIERLRGTERFPADPVAGNSWERFSNGSYGLVYSRTALLFHDLDRRLGGEAFARGMKLYYARFHHRHPSTADLREALAEGSGQRALVERWFEEQVYGNGPIDDRIVELKSEEILPRPGTVVREGKRVELDEKAVDRDIADARAAWQRSNGRPPADGPGPFPFRTTLVARRFQAHVPQRIALVFADGSREVLEFPAEERWHRWVLERRVRAVEAQLDPDRDFFLDIDKLDDGRTRKAHPLAARQLALDLSGLLQLALSLLVIQ